ncbi:MAG: 50S ribosomal protein L11 methyltransferase [Candidatus Curtissbacteria bacterium]|nr:50S ribosomal protein L11 methyltransferase [Candidatus Curtissbacteria bacterium]
MIIFVGILLLITTFLILFVVLIFMTIAVSLFLELPYVATTNKRIETIIKFAKIKKNQTVIDLGSGDGRLLVKSAQLGAIAIGYEINPLLVLFTKLRAHLNGLSQKVIVNNKSLWNADLKVADVIFVYALKKSMKKFDDFVFSGAKPGTRIVVNTNPFPGKKSQKEENGIFLYVT